MSIKTVKATQHKSLMRQLNAGCLAEFRYIISPMKKGPSPISPILKTMVRNFGLEKGMDLYLLKDRWYDLVGEPIASHTFPQAIRYKILTLHVDGATWMHELSFFKEEIIRKINEGLGKKAIHSLRLKLAPTSPHKEPERKRVKTPPIRQGLSKEASERLRQQLLSISDHRLKGVIRRAMERHMGKKESL